MVGYITGVEVLEPAKISFSELYEAIATSSFNIDVVVDQLS